MPKQRRSCRSGRQARLGIYTGVRSSVMGFKTTELLQSTEEKGSSVKVRSLHNDLITLLNNKGLKVDGVSYTAKQAQKEGWTIVF